MTLSAKKRSVLLIAICFLLYFSSYLLKYSYNANIINLETKYSVTHAETGLVSSLFFISYGIGQFINGFFVRKYPLKYIMPFVVLVSCVLNILVLTTPTDMFYLIKIYWVINGLALSFLWPCTVRFFVENVDEKYKDVGIFIIGTECALGPGVTYLLSSIFTKINKFSLIFIVAACLGVISIILWFVFFRTMINNNKEEVKVEKIVTTKVRTRFIIYTTLCIFLCISLTFVRDGIENWAPSMLNEMFDISKSNSVFITVILPIAQFIGISLGSISKRYVKSHVLLCTLFFLAAALALAIAWMFNFNNKVMLIVAMFIVVVAVSGPIHIIVDILPVAWSKERNSGLFSGVFNGCCFIGSAVASFGLSKIADNNGWNIVFIVLSIVSFIGVIVPLIYYLSREVYQEKTGTII